MSDPIETAAETVGLAAAGVAMTAEAVNDVADGVVEANRSARRLLKLLLLLTVIGIVIAIAAKAANRGNGETEVDY